MTDEQIVQFIVHRAQISGQPQQLHNPKLVIYCHHTSSLYLGIKYEDCTDPFLVRFINGSSRGLFKVKPQDAAFEIWRQQLYRANGFGFTLDYILSELPPCVKHFVSYAIIEALKTKGMGFDLFNLSFISDLELVRPEESYEEAVIETDLADFSFDSPAELTEVPSL